VALDRLHRAGARDERDGRCAAALLRIVVDYDNAIEHRTAVVLVLSEWLRRGDRLTRQRSELFMSDVSA
jgi:hypothetical protein